MSGPVIVSGVRPAPESIEAQLLRITRRLNETEAALHVVRVAASRAVGFLANVEVPAHHRDQHLEILADLRQALRQSSQWPFPRDPAEQQALAREHQAQQRAAVVNGPEAPL